MEKAHQQEGEEEEACHEAPDSTCNATDSLLSAQGEAVGSPYGKHAHMLNRVLGIPIKMYKIMLKKGWSENNLTINSTHLVVSYQWQQWGKKIWVELSHGMCSVIALTLHTSQCYLLCG